MSNQILYVKTLIDEKELTRLRHIEKSYYTLLHKRKQQEEEESAASMNGGGIILPEFIPPEQPPIGASIFIEKNLTEPLEAEQIHPFIPKRLHSRARKLLDDLKETSLFIDSSGNVTYKNTKIPGSGIALVKATIYPSKKIVQGKHSI